MTESAGARRPRLLLLDNYDSFTWNLAQYMEEVGADVTVELSDRIDVDEVHRRKFDGLVISPGPGRPEDAGISLELIPVLPEQMPLLGVCLGYQAIAQAYGAQIVQAPTLVHGKTSSIEHLGNGIFSGLPSPFEATRYHSLVVDEATLDPIFEVNARTREGLAMSLRHRQLPIHGVQFHPESILTVEGKRLLGNFVKIAGGVACPAC
jgi:anthranilate synthase/aminodeoxychorismate synthase-like glutamine amidotransferase